ncbi:MAG: c-type cytochrome [Phycisphaerae bacterium]
MKGLHAPLRVAAKLSALVVIACAPHLGRAQETPPPENEETVQAGKIIYEMRCAACHGLEGDGQGLAAPHMLPQPRDFTDIVYKLRSTASGERPLEIDLFRTVSQGVPGTPMTSWQEILSERQRWQVVHYIKTFAAEDWAEELPEDVVIKLPDWEGVGGVARDTAKRGDDRTLARGKKLYEVLKCGECHGDGGKGNGPSAKTVQDEFGNPMWPADLTRPDLFRGGSGIQDIARAFITGLGTTPMPSYDDYFTLFSESEDLPEDQVILHVPRDTNALALAHYVLSLGANQSPKRQRREEQQILASYTDGEIPDDPDSPEWDKTQGVIMKLSAQLTVAPRWQFANVDRLLVDALYNDEELGILIQWDDRTEDREHEEDDYKFEARSKSVALPTRNDLAELRQKAFADALSIQFPTGTGEGAKRPFFALGEPEAPVESWRWQASPLVRALANQPAGRDGERFTAKGFHLPPENVEELFTNAKYDDGRWKVVFKVAIAEDKRFTPGQYLPIAFAAWDGSNGESGTRCSISSWYWFLLKPRGSAAPYAYALLAFVMIGLGEFLLIKRLRENQQDPAMQII